MSRGPYVQHIAVWCSWCQRLRGSAETVRIVQLAGRKLALHACADCRAVYRLCPLDDMPRAGSGPECGPEPEDVPPVG